MLKQLKSWWAAVWTTLKGWKTLIVSTVLAVIGVLQTADWATIVSPQHVGPTILGIAILVAVLRAATDTAVGRGGGDSTKGRSAT